MKRSLVQLCALILVGVLWMQVFPKTRASSPEWLGTTERLSVSTSGAQANGWSILPVISANGRYVVFSSAANNLVSGDTNEHSDIFLRDLWERTTRRVSVTDKSEEANADCTQPDISADGLYVTFFSSASNLVLHDTNGVADVFVVNNETREIKRVSVSSLGEEGKGASNSAHISRDGRYVGFSSWASNLVSGDTNWFWDAFLHDRETGKTERISVSSSGGDSDGESYYGAISADGRYVAFSSSAYNLVGGTFSWFHAVYLRDRQYKINERVSVSNSGQPADDHCNFGGMSDDARYIVFSSEASNLVDDDTNWKSDIFVRDRQTGTTERVSVSSSGEQGDEHSYSASISADGRFVAFMSRASNLVPGDTNDLWDIFVHDRKTKETTRVSVSSTGEEANGSSWNLSISADGRFVVFSSEASNLVSGDTNGKEDIFIHDRCPGLICLPIKLYMPVAVR